MKANELMIGDWVQVHQFYIDEETEEKVFYYEKPIYMQVEAVYQDLIATIAPWTDPKDESTYDEALLEEIEPIPLTSEILEKNGCTMIDKGDYGEWHIKENPNIPLWQHTEFIIFGGIEIHYVHELQHALRLCGLTELADNFKL